jgi:alkaline phosphatase D
MKLHNHLLIFALSFLAINSCHQREIKTHKNKSNVPHFRPDSNKVIENIFFGSCSNQALDQSYWNVIGSKNPDLFIWLGDVIYSDTKDMDEHQQQYDILKNNPNYSTFIKKYPVIGIWDDHDYGVNDGGGGFSKKKESKKLFLDFLDIPSTDKVYKHQGLYTSYTFGQDLRTVKIYLLDTRYFRSDLKLSSKDGNRYEPSPTGTILGEEQWKWLENEVKNSKATYNIFVSGIQVIPDDHGYEKWGNFPHERQKFLDLIEKSKVKNPIIISGDRHFAELSEYTLQDFSGVITELTSSGLTHSFEGANEFNAYRRGELFDGKNFGHIKLIYGGSKAMCKLYIYDILGNMIFEHGLIGEY